jgi:hypothetical protein
MPAIMAVINEISVICSNKTHEPSRPSAILAVCDSLGRVGELLGACRDGARPCLQTANEAEVALSAVARSIAMLFISLASPLHAQVPLLDPNLPSVKPQTLQHLSDNRVRQRIMQESQARFVGRCVCPYQTNDLNGRSCKRRHEVITTPPRPICYPSQVTKEMVSDWRRHH